MTVEKGSVIEINWKQVMEQDENFLKALVKKTLQEILEGEMTELLGAGKGERTESRNGHRSGYYSRGLNTRVGRINLRIPQDREGRFSTQLFGRYQRSEKALLAAMGEMYIQGVSTRRVSAIVEELCGLDFSAGTISNITKQLDEELRKFATRRLEEEYPHLVLDARYEKIREDGVVRSQAVLVAVGINKAGKREVLAVEVANRESETSWRDFLLGLKGRGLRGVKYLVSDDHAGLKKAVVEVLPDALRQRCYVHFLRNFLGHVPRNLDKNCLNELRQIYKSADLEDARRRLRNWINNWQEAYPKAVLWVEENIEETLSFFSLPMEHRKHLSSTNMLERLNEEIKRRTRVVRIFPNIASCLRLIRALTVEATEEWSARVYLPQATERIHSEVVTLKATA